MSKLRIIVALAKYLYSQRYPDGLRYTINRVPSGETWFLVERATILVPFNDCAKPEIVVDGKRYVRVGGGKFEGKYVFVGDDVPTDPNACRNEDGEPMTFDEWSREIDQVFGK